MTENISSEIITVVAAMKAKPGKDEQLRSAALALVEPTRAEEGCIQYDLHQHLTEPAWLVFYENWTSAEALERHAASPHIKAFGEIARELRESSRVDKYRRIA